ncbi:OpgC domain-containing protein [Rhizobium sp. NFACC06-2]|uniref:OpgC domain-containing protein n=1 Tax=Rhizobium sp. NFACC06-2 TaxID=1566264 RepID=UPI000876FBED|nr:OpgC domain-containing protein [Rhizobium sp. NFACC06-2]SCY73335.1 OpgC protein [Rhizobium sp. NFACC06-2]
MTETAANSRIIGIDLTRSIAIFFAMLSHVWVVTAMDQFWSGPSADFLRALMALATPTFILLFGTMLEIIYRPKFLQGEQGAVTARLVSRAVQCWLLYCLSVVVLYLVPDGYSLKFSIATMMLLGVTPFTDILKFYAVVLFLAPILLLLRTKTGLLPLLLAAVAVHLVHPALREMPSPIDFQMSMNAERVATFLFGIGDGKLGGPSVLHGLSLIIGGMAFGRLIAGDRAACSETTSGIAKRASFLLAASALAVPIGAFLSREGLLAELGDMSLRMDSDPLYFAAGFCGAVSLTSLAVLATQGLSDKGQKPLEKLVFFGRSSLFTFAFGNMILYAWRDTPDTRGSAALQAVFISMVIIGLSYLFDREMRHRGRLSTVVRSLQAKITSFVKMLIALRIPSAEQS